MRNTSDIQKLFFLENIVVYEIMWKNIAESDRPQMTIWRMRIASSVPTATNTHQEYVILIPFPLQQWFHDRARVLHYMCTDFLAHFCVVSEIINK